jgi:hypothetical protein
MDALTLYLVLSLSCQEYRSEMLPVFMGYVNSQSQDPAIRLSHYVLDEDMRWICARFPDKTLNWAIDVIHQADIDCQSDDGRYVRYIRED